MNRSLLSKIILILAAALIWSHAAQAQSKQAIPVRSYPIHFILNGKDVTPQSGLFFNGKYYIPDSLFYEGTYFVPLRLIAKFFHTGIHWNALKHAILLGTNGNYLSNLAFKSDILLNPDEAIALNNAQPDPYWNPPMKIKGESYKHGISFQLFNGDSAEATWNLQGKYSQLKAVLGLDDQTHSGSPKAANAYLATTATITFIGDGQTLQTFAIGSVTTPTKINISLTGVQTLTIKVQMETMHGNLAMLDLVHPALKK